MKGDKPVSVYGFLCGIAWDHELGNTDVEVFPSERSLLAKHPFAYHPKKGCGGVVRIRMTFVSRRRKRQRSGTAR